MKRRWFLLLVSHALVLCAGFAIGIYTLPLLIAPTAPTAVEVADAARGAAYTATFRRDLKDSDLLHWGEGQVSISPARIALAGRLAPGPDYKLYLSPTFVETEADFARLKSSMVRVGDIRTFDNFVVDVPPGIDVAAFSAVIVWCETFSQFITAAAYR